MKIKADSIVTRRKKRSWSQDELATAAGLNLRTVQRIENEGTASLESMKAIASAFQATVEDFATNGSSQMHSFEYKTVVLPFKFGIIKAGMPDIQTALNKEGAQGWQLKQVMMSAMEGGRSDSVLVIFERMLAAA